MEHTLKIGDKEYYLTFNYGQMVRLGKLLGNDTYDGTVNEVALAVQSAQQKEKQGASLPFKILNVLSRLAQSALTKEDALELDADTLADFFLHNMDELPLVIENWMQSMPKPKEESKKKVSKKT